ncbi:MAG TPA: type 4a pilus biogenesis protein PilO [Candidatus Tectomicrobia bacterium]
MEWLDGIPPSYRWLAIPGFVVLLAVLYWNFFYQPYVEEMELLQDKLNAKRQTVAKHKRIAARLDTFKAQVSDLEARLRALLRELPESREIPGMIRQISDIGVRTGLQINLIKPQPEQRKEFYAEIPIQVRVKGHYHAVGRFFDDLAHLERIISVSGIQIEATSQETQCLATTFRFLDEAEANEAAAAAKKGAKK